MITTRRQFAVPLFGLAILGGLFPTADAASAAMALEDDGLPPNVFFSPHGQPFRARRDADYPVVDWFRQADADGDGKLTHKEFLADALNFFRYLDLNSDGVLDRIEINVYENKIAPEVLGAHLNLGANQDPRARKWLVQAHPETSIDPGGDVPNAPATPKGLDESGVGASPYGFFQEPEPVAAADLDLKGVVSRANFLKLAEMHFTTLDESGAGYLTLARLPKTEAQKVLERARPHRRKS